MGVARMDRDGFGVVRSPQKVWGRIEPFVERKRIGPCPIAPRPPLLWRASPSTWSWSSFVSSDSPRPPTPRRAEGLLSLPEGGGIGCSSVLLSAARPCPSPAPTSPPPLPLHPRSHPHTTPHLPQPLGVLCATWVCFVPPFATQMFAMHSALACSDVLRSVYLLRSLCGFVFGFLLNFLIASLCGSSLDVWFGLLFGLVFGSLVWFIFRLLTSFLVRFSCSVSHSVSRLVHCFVHCPVFCSVHYSVFYSCSYFDFLCAGTSSQDGKTRPTRRRNRGERRGRCRFRRTPRTGWKSHTRYSILCSITSAGCLHRYGYIATIRTLPSEIPLKTASLRTLPLYRCRYAPTFRFIATVTSLPLHRHRYILDHHRFFATVTSLPLYCHRAVTSLRYPAAVTLLPLHRCAVTFLSLCRYIASADTYYGGP